MMSKIFLLVVLIACWAQAQSAAVDDVETAWKEHKTKHGRKHKTAAEETERKTHFSKAHAKIAKHNSDPNATFKMAHNKFSDMSETEIKALYGFKPSAIPAGARIAQMSDRAVPAAVDLRTGSTCMQPVKDQGQCGSCYAFSSLAVVEYNTCVKTGKPVALSEQQIVDCAASYGTYGCDGGWQPDAWAYIAGNGGVDTSVSYPYKSGTTMAVGTCSFKAASIGGKVLPKATPATWQNSATYIAGKDVTTMQTVLAGNSTIATGIYASDALMSYSTGVFSDPACGTLDANHAVNIVGYGTLNAVPYWIVRNSWGTGWGQAGYVLFKRGVNMCAIEVNAMYTTVA